MLEFGLYVKIFLGTVYYFIEPCRQAEWLKAVFFPKHLSKLIHIWLPVLHSCDL